MKKQNELEIITKIELEEIVCPFCGEHGFQENLEINENVCIRNLFCISCNNWWSENFIINILGKK